MEYNQRRRIVLMRQLLQDVGCELACDTWCDLAKHPDPCRTVCTLGCQVVGDEAEKRGSGRAFLGVLGILAVLGWAARSWKRG